MSKGRRNKKHWKATPGTAFQYQRRINLNNIAQPFEVCRGASVSSAREPDSGVELNENCTKQRACSWKQVRAVAVLRKAFVTMNFRAKTSVETACDPNSILGVVSAKECERKSRDIPVRSFPSMIRWRGREMEKWSV
jgi:hypothetical protein